MRKLLIIILLPLFLAGCTEYARMEQVRVGMPIDEFLQLSTPCYQKAILDSTVAYSCRFDAAYGQDQRSVRPYIVTFENGVLSQIVFDEQEHNRQLQRRQYHYGYGYGHSFRYGYRGHRYHSPC